MNIRTEVREIEKHINNLSASTKAEKIAYQTRSNDMKQADAINSIANRILRTGCRHTDGDVNMMLVNYYNMLQKNATRRDFSRAIDKIQAIVKKNEANA